MGGIVTSKGWFTVPKPIRDLLGITPGTRLDVTVTADRRIILMRSDEGVPKKSFASFRGHAGKGLDTDSIMALTRGETIHSED